MNQLNDIENNINSLNEYNINLSKHLLMNTYVDNFIDMKQTYIDNMLNFLYYSIYNIYYYLIEEKNIKKE